jgi:hypothetical protein
MEVDMQLFSTKRLIRLYALGAVALALGTGEAASEKVGVTAAVNPSATGTAPGQAVRQLKIGSDIVRNERVQTSSGGSTQVIFVDRTTLTISPSSDLTINEFVYNPQAKSGNLAVNVGKGLVRFVGGELSHRGNVQIKTPFATMGIRGGMALINNSGGQTTVVHLYGSTTITNGSKTITISKPGFHTTINGAQMANPTVAPPGLVASYIARLQSKPGQTGKQAGACDFG